MRITYGTVGDALVLALSGWLDVPAAAPLRTALRKALLDSPRPVVCDVTEVSGFSRAALTVFATAFAEVGGWPVVRFAVMDPAPALASALQEVAIARRVPVLTSEQVAHGGAQMWRPELLTRSVGISASGHAAAEARLEVAAFCSVAGCGDDLLDDARIIASELATNAVRHGSPPIELDLLASAHALTVSVRDASAQPAVLGQTRGESGRGLSIVQALATAWRSDPLPGDGKTVWARLRRPS